MGSLCYFGPLPPFQGGIAQHASIVIEALRRHGYEVSATSWASQYPSLLYPGRQPSSAEKRSADPRTRFLAHWWNPLDWWHVGRGARSGGIGLIQPWVTPFHTLSVVVSAWAARPTPTILIVHNVETHEWFPLRKLLTRIALRSVTAVLAHSDVIAQQVRQLAPSTPVVCAPMPPLVNVVGGQLPPPTPLRLLMVGYVRPYKGLEIALDAVKRLVSAGVDLRLSVMGEFWDPSLSDARHMVQVRGLNDVVDLTDGYLADAELLENLASHHLVILPYLTATQSAVAPLAHAAHRAVIASKLPGLAEQINDGVDGILFEPGSASALAEAIRLASDRLDSLHRGAAARPHGADQIVQRLVPFFGAV